MAIPKNEGKLQEQQRRDARLRDELRANLMKRKAQAKAVASENEAQAKAVASENEAQAKAVASDNKAKARRLSESPATDQDQDR